MGVDCSLNLGRKESYRIDTCRLLFKEKVQALFSHVDLVILHLYWFKKKIA